MSRVRLPGFLYFLSPLIQWPGLAESESLCVYCHRQPMEPAWQPFCSERCRMADLGRWLSEDYRVPDERPVDVPDDEADRESDD